MIWGGGGRESRKKKKIGEYFERHSPGILRGHAEEDFLYGRGSQEKINSF